VGKQARAVICRELGKPVVVETVEVESPRRGEVMVKLAACGVCHSDLSATNGTIPLPPPLVLGHEAAGVVEEVGEGVTGVAVGDPVILCWIPMCGRCRYCGEGRPALCELAAKAAATLPDGTTRFKDAHGAPLFHFAGVGVMAERATVHQNNVIPIDAGVPLDKAAVLGCAVMTGVGAAINTAKVRPGSSVAVFGCGGVGLNAVQGAALCGADRIIAVDTSDRKLELAREFGATHTLNPASDGDAVRRIRELTGGGVDYGFECIGLPATIQQTFDAVGKGGMAVLVGVTKPADQIQLGSFLFIFTEKEIKGSLYGSCQPRYDFPRLISLYRAGRLKLDELVSRTYDIDDAPRAFEDMLAGQNARGVIVF
jgi:S-(hydroxymethyl)glutathione dehydrogenase/alcohol dehydrogenase